VVEVGPERPGLYDSLCHFSPDVEVTDADCGMAARWHLRVKVVGYAEELMLQSCDGHHGLAIRVGEVRSMHEFGSACGLEDSWWIGEGDAGCMMLEAAVEAGILRYVDPDHPEANWVRDPGGEWTRRP